MIYYLFIYRYLSLTTDYFVVGDSFVIDLIDLLIKNGKNQKIIYDNF
ncbi:MAG: hypothetical protein LBP87_11610 [Planctomycetaceae bacterium]|nr:hypothetical protein [Planctomycetaceae bacterium]